MRGIPWPSPTAFWAAARLPSSIGTSRGYQHQEEMLANEGMLILKFWMHLSKKDFEARHKALARHPETRWRVTEEDQETYKRYGKLKKLAEHALRMTSTAQAPWIVVEGLDERYRNLTVGTVLLNALKERLEQKNTEAGHRGKRAPRRRAPGRQPARPARSHEEARSQGL